MSNAKGQQDLHCLNSHIGIARSSSRSETMSFQLKQEYHCQLSQLSSSIQDISNVFCQPMQRCSSNQQSHQTDGESTGCPDRSAGWLVGLPPVVVTQWETQQQQRKFRSSQDERADSRKRASTQVKHLYCREWHIWSNGPKTCGGLIAGNPPRCLLACVG